MSIASIRWLLHLAKRSCNQQRLMRLLSTIILLLNIIQVFSQSSYEDAIDSLFEHYDAQSPGVSVLVTK